MIDVDSHSAYLGQVPTILEALETIGICRTVITRSSWSGGLHIYAPLPKAYPTFSVAVAVTTALEAQGLLVQSGQLEVFPNVKTYGKFWRGEFTDYNGHRLPLQVGTGSCILNDDLQPVAGGEQLARFFALWDNALLFQDEETIDQALAIARINRRRRRAVGPVESWRADLQQLIGEGWTGPGQTNHLLKEIGCYGRVFEGLSGVELAEYIERTATTAPGYERWCRHQHEIWRRCCVWGKAVEKYYWPLGAEPLRDRPTFTQLCTESANEARRRISEAIAQLPGPVATVKELARTLCRMARCSQQTLYKNRDLWNPSPPPPPDQPVEGVTDQPTGAVGPLGAIRAQIIESLESADLAWVTPYGGKDETCSPEKPPLKIFTSGSGEGGPGGGGLSPGSNHA
jgi:hypothetical protein